MSTHKNTGADTIESIREIIRNGTCNLKVIEEEKERDIDDSKVCWFCNVDNYPSFTRNNDPANGERCYRCGNKQP